MKSNASYEIGTSTIYSGSALFFTSQSQCRLQAVRTTSVGDKEYIIAHA